MHSIDVHDVMTFARRMHQAFGYEIRQFELAPAQETGLVEMGAMNLNVETLKSHELGAGSYTIELKWQQHLNGQWSFSCGFTGDLVRIAHTQKELEEAITTALRTMFQNRIIKEI